MVTLTKRDLRMPLSRRTAIKLRDAVNQSPQANTVETADIQDGAVTVAKLTPGYREVAQDGALALAVGDETIHLVSSTTGAKAATMTTTGMPAGKRIRVFLRARSGGSYTLAVAGPLTVTLDAAGEGVDLVFDGTSWRTEGSSALLGGATAA